LNYSTPCIRSDDNCCRMGLRHGATHR
jgi:hypothetical protein